MKFVGQVGCVTRTNCLDFGEDPDVDQEFNKNLKSDFSTLSGRATNYREHDISKSYGRIRTIHGG